MKIRTDLTETGYHDMRSDIGIPMDYRLMPDVVPAPQVYVVFDHHAVLNDVVLQGNNSLRSWRCARQRLWS